MEKLQFIYTETGEFDEPFYEIFDQEGFGCAMLGFDGEQWALTELDYCFEFTTSELSQIIAKLEELNDSLAQRRSKFFGF